eukprot:scaffold42574_cov65-Attheya_sp.AAC.4
MLEHDLCGHAVTALRPLGCTCDAVDIASVRIESDVAYRYRNGDDILNPELMHDEPLKGFPLEAVQKSQSSSKSKTPSQEIDRHRKEEGQKKETEPAFLCTQGVGGQLTHFFSGNLHAIDCRCKVGTPILAVEDGEVVEVLDGSMLSGIGVSNMFSWNSFMIRHRDDKCHDEGDADDNEEHEQPKRGDRIECSGSVGFSPEPHLHFAVFQSGKADAVSVGFEFKGADGVPYRPVAGNFYNASGPCV